MRRKIVCGLVLVCSLVLCTASGAFGQSAYATSLDEPGMTIVSAPNHTTVLSLHNMPPGNYVINAKRNVVARLFYYSDWRLRCWISSSTDKLDITELAPIPPAFGPNDTTQPLPLHAFVALSAPDTISLSCNLTRPLLPPEQSPVAFFARLSAIQVGELHVE